MCRPPKSRRQKKGHWKPFGDYLVMLRHIAQMTGSRAMGENSQRAGQRDASKEGFEVPGSPAGRWRDCFHITIVSVKTEITVNLILVKRALTLEGRHDSLATNHE